MNKTSLDGDPLSAYAASNASPLSTTPHLPVFQGPFRPSFDNDKSLQHVDLGDDDLEGRSLLTPFASNGNGVVGTFVEDDDDEDENGQGFEPPTKVEETVMLASIGVVLLFSVAAGLTTVCDWVL
ncbi:hypothetical protein QFC21_002231 [Naganishia friedmannii]|uniref:Uncharacterized protein n=1 Tax=Naganishia friedmannii TaxID=89922 RepID=A0ACC2VXQ9_9TREE|nr:hypothetical protein QFC21_002231 [Naganishia friedmannii]